MTEDEYLRGEPYNNNDQDLPSAFMADEDIATDTNVIMIPNLKKINVNLQLDNYVEVISKLKTKYELKIALGQIWQHAAEYGGLVERVDKLQMEVEMLQYDVDATDYEIEFVDGEEE